MSKPNLKRGVKASLRPLRPAAKLLLRPFFGSEYLSGRFFDTHLSGYRWALRAIWQRNILRLARPLPFPANHSVSVANPANLVFHPDDLNNFQSFGIYLQNFNGKIVLGRGCYIAPNVGIITANHDPLALDAHLPGKDVVLGDGCWLGMNSVVLPGVVLGPNTVVGAGSVVTKSFPEGKCIIAGNPAKFIRDL